MRIKRAFTLIEMMVALAILALIASVTAIQVKKLIDTHRFEAEVGDLFIALQEAQVLAAGYQTDFALDLYFKKGTLFYQLSTDEPLSKKKCNQAPIPLAHTALFKCGGKKVTSLHLDIYSGGRVEPRELLSFSQDQSDDKAIWLDLRRGHLLKFFHHKPPAVKQQIPSQPK